MFTNRNHNKKTVTLIMFLFYNLGGTDKYEELNPLLFIEIEILGKRYIFKNLRVQSQALRFVIINPSSL